MRQVANTAVLMLWLVLTLFGLTTAEARAASQLMDYFMPTPIIDSLSTTAWGAAQVGPRDPSNGLEDKTLAKWVYWDGGILKAPDGTYHMFASRWDQSNGHNGWMCCSYAIHATSKSLYGPYTDLGTFYTFDGGKGHNVTPFVLPNGQYGVSISGVRAGRVFTASSLDGPWTDKGDVQVSGGLCTQCNMKIMYRPDGQYMAIASDGRFALGPNVTGPYVTQGASFYSQISSLTDTSKLEDPSVWYSGGKYHWLTNQWATRKAYHFTSTDGIKDWKVDQGYAYDPTSNFIRYTDGTVNHWAHIERPEVYIEDGHVVAFTFAAINVDKDQDKAGDKNGSKVIVVPFDGAALDLGSAPGVGGSGGGTGTSGGGGRGGTGGTTGAGTGGTTGLGGISGSGSGGASSTGGRGGRGGAGGTSALGLGGTSGTGGSAGTSSLAGIGGTSGLGGSGGTSHSGAGGQGGSSLTSSRSDGGGGGGTATTGGAGGASSSAVPSGGATTVAGSAGGSSGGSHSPGGAGGASGKDDGCSCALGGPRSPGASVNPLALLLLGLLAFARGRFRRS
jgi:MYXO-CTERM domain-containing protein